jgi:hypothetical protein
MHPRANSGPGTVISKAVTYAGALANGWRDEGWRIMLRVPGRLRREFFGREGQTSGKQLPTPVLSATVVRAGGWSAEEITDLNEIARNSTQDWLAFVPAHAESEPHMLNYLIQHANENPHAAIVYADEDGPVAGTLARHDICRRSIRDASCLQLYRSPVVIRRKSFLNWADCVQNAPPPTTIVATGMGCGSQFLASSDDAGPSQGTN